MKYYEIEKKFLGVKKYMVYEKLYWHYICKYKNDTLL